MAYFTLLWKARTIEKYRLNYEREKQNSISLTTAQNPKKTLYQKWCNYNLRTKKRLSNAFLSRYPEGSRVYNIISYLRLDQTFPNFILKSAIGFLAGIILTYLCFMFFVFQLSISLIHATIVSSIIGVLLTLGLAFSYRIRCLVFLLIPQFFSRVGRYTLTCYALVLILTGPATNTLKNSEVLSESLACSQEQIKVNMVQVNESLQKPFMAMRDSIKMLIKSLERLATKLKLLVVRMQRLVLNLAHSLQSGYSWLESTAANCNKKLGTPYDRCSASISTAIVECQAALGPRFSSFCNAAKITDAVCWPVVSLKSFCRVIDFVNGNILGVVNRKLKIFTERINTMLQLEVHIHHSYSFTSNSNKSGNQAAAGIVTEIRNRADPLLTWLSWSSCITSLSLLLIIFRAKYYQHMFETRSRFDNRYVTKQLRDLDLKRLKQGKETVLPLNRREEGKYINTTSFHLVSSERVHLSKSIVTMAITTFKLMIHMVADYSLYWVLTTIRYHGRLQTPLQSDFQTSAHVSGSGLVSKIMKSLISSITLPLTSSPSSPTKCLPNPHPPDLQRYSQIGILIVLLWFFALFEPYGLRLRHVIMGLYRPERAKTRAIWLYNHIQRTRGGFMKFARRKLHREYKYSSEEKHTLRYWLDSHISCVCIKDMLGISKGFPRCSLCGVIESCNQCDAVLVRCETPKCPGIYCSKCFSDIGLLCTICLSPEDYGDLSDVSLEKGSSDSESDDSQDDYVPSRFTTKNKQVMFEMEEGRCVLPDEKNNQNKSGLFGKNVNNDNESNSSNTLKEGGIKSKFVFDSLNKPNRKFTDYVVDNDTRKAITSVGQDAMCLNYDRVFKCYAKDLVYVVSSQFKDTNYGQYRGYCNATLNTNVKRGSNFRKAYYNKHSQQNKGTNISESNNSLLQRFQNSRKYSVNFNLSRNIKDNFDSSKTVTRKLEIRRKRPRTKKKKRKVEFSDYFDIFSAERIIIPRLDLQSNQFVTKHTLKYQSKSRKCRQIKVMSEKVHNLILKLRRRRIICQLSSKLFSKGVGNNRQMENKTTKKSPKDVPKKAEKPKQKNRGQEPFKKKLAEQKAITIMKTNHSIGIKGNNEINDQHKEPDGRNHLKCIGSKIFANFTRKKEFTLDHEKTNHKKRKKPEDSMNTSRKNKRDNEANRKYRISSYLSEQEWIKKHFKSEIQFTKIKKLVEDDSFNVKQIVKDVLNNECFKSNKNNNNREKEVVVIHKNVNAVMPEKHSVDSPMFNSLSLNCGLPRSIKYFGDLGHHDFDHEHGIVNTENACYDYLNTKGPSEIFGACSDPKANKDAVRTINRDPGQVKTDKVESFAKLKAEPKKISNKNFTDIKLPTDEKGKRKVKFKQSMNLLSILFPCLTHRKKYQKNKADAIVEVSPTVNNCSCQYDIKEISKENTTKVFLKKDAEQSMTHDSIQEVHVANLTCTCATQYDKQCKDATTCSSCKTKTKQRSKVKETANEEGNDKSKAFKPKANKEKKKKNTVTLHELYRKHFENIGIQCKFGRQYSHTHKFNEKSTSSESSLSLDSVLSLSTIRSDDTKTDTTVYNMRDVKYTMKSNNKKPVKVMITTKANRFTETDEKKLCDVSTITNDWWSPILERKDKSLSLPVKSPLLKSRHIKREKKETKTSGMTTEGRVVAFKSHTQIIPPKKSLKRTEVDILSPSRYLLESQKYYNELFATRRLYAPEVWSLSTSQRNELQRMPMAPRPPTTWKRRYCKAKRLEECYSPRKMMHQKIPVWTAESTIHSSSTTKRNYRLGTKSRNPKMSHRHFYGKPTLRFKRGHVNLYTRCYVSNEDVSQISGKNANSYGTTVANNTTSP